MSPVGSPVNHLSATIGSRVKSKRRLYQESLANDSNKYEKQVDIEAEIKAANTKKIRSQTTSETIATIEANIASNTQPNHSSQLSEPQFLAKHDVHVNIKDVKKLYKQNLEKDANKNQSDALMMTSSEKKTKIAKNKGNKTHKKNTI